jgi:hypothetical protein
MGTIDVSRTGVRGIDARRAQIAVFRTDVVESAAHLARVRIK